MTTLRRLIGLLRRRHEHRAIYSEWCDIRLHRDIFGWELVLSEVAGHRCGECSRVEWVNRSRVVGHRFLGEQDVVSHRWYRLPLY